MSSTSTITEDEFDLIKTLRKSFSEENVHLDSYVYNDSYLTRVLRVNAMNLDNSFRMLVKILNWRKENQMDKIIDWEPGDFFLKEPQYFFTGAKTDGSPILYVPFGKWDFKKLLDVGLEDDGFKYIIQMVEKAEILLRARAQEEPGKVHQIQILVDANGFSYRQLASIKVINLFIQKCQVFEQNFPDVFSCTYFIRAPAIWTMFFNLIKKVLSKRCQDALQVYGSSEAQWKADINKNFPIGTVPKHLGGTFSIEQKY